MPKTKSKTKKVKIVAVPQNLLFVLGLFIVIVGLGVLSLLLNYFQYLRRAHSSFENYYAFRGCTRLIQKTDTYGYCQSSSGQTVKLVKFDNRWYLDGDLPICFSGLCF